ncbi:MAG: single-stranded DNA-binding protein [Candidatus Thermoplasmatota archaeon]|nr:single-stranded DNA-binding protein [Candidatus Thermoplasmatota archaeon]
MKQRSQNKDALIEKLSSLDSSKEKKSYKDERFWRPTVDDSGTASAIIRFLPECEGEEDAAVLYFSHAFQGPGGWFIENSRTTFGEKDPVSEYNSRLWNSGIQANKDMVSQKTKRKKNFVSNILVVSDPACPENEGKVFLFRYGMKIHQKLLDAMKPEFADEDPIIPFDFWQGANFRLRQRKVAGYPNYDKSEFDSPSALFDGDEGRLKEVWGTPYPLSEFVDPANYKSYDELKTRLETVLGGTQPTTTAENTALDEKVEVSSTSEAAPQRESVEPDSEEDALSYFQRLSEED